jgi:hypothetical protein
VRDESRAAEAALVSDTFFFSSLAIGLAVERAMLTAVRAGGQARVALARGPP